MTNKRQLARAALQAWKTKTTAEMFIEQHKDVHFANTNKSPKVELVSSTERYMELVTKEFAHLTMRRSNQSMIKSAFSNLYMNAIKFADVLNIEENAIICAKFVVYKNPNEYLEIFPLGTI